VQISFAPIAVKHNAVAGGCRIILHLTTPLSTSGKPWQRSPGLNRNLAGREGHPLVSLLCKTAAVGWGAKGVHRILGCDIKSFPGFWVLTERWP